MSKLRVFVTILVCVASGTAQTRRSPAGEPPLHVRDGQAVLVGHFSPQQMLRLAIGLEHPRLAEEEQFLRELTTLGSPNFRKFLTADEWNARFSPAPQDEQAVVDWAQSQGLTITHRYPNRLIVDVEGAVDTVERSMQVRINQYRQDGYTYYANEREPVLPARVSALIHSISGLNNMGAMHPASFPGQRPPGPAYLPGPVVGKGVNHRVDGDRAAFQAAMARSRARAAAGDTPGLTNGKYDPTDMYNSNLYNYGGLQNLGWCCNPDHVGGGAPPRGSIAVAALGNLQVDGSNHLTDIIGYHNQYPYLADNVTTVPVDGGGISCTVGPNSPCNDDGETTLDTEMATAYANSFGSYLDTAQVWVYEGPNNGSSNEDVYNTILSDGHARVVTHSWDCPETGSCLGSGEMDTTHGIFNSMLGQGWTILNSSGDTGATADCATTVVNYPTSDPDVTSVGGTFLKVFVNADGSLNSFDSEVAWTGGTGAKSCSTNNGGSGGGCSGHFSRPGYQDSANGGCGSQRSVPDVALNSAAGQNFYFNGSLGGVGGTSVASPMMAGFFAQENAYLIHLDDVTGNDCGSTHQPCGTIGWANPYLYTFGKNPTYAPHYPFYDITSGCNTNDITAGNSSLTFYCAGTGYDSVTGWGSSNMLQLAWALNTYFAGSFAAPDVGFTGPAAGNVWYRTPQSLNWTLTPVSNGANNGKANGIAGFSQAWDGGLAPDSSTKATPGSGDSFYSGPQFPNATSGFLNLNNTLEGCHTAHVRTWDNGGTTGDHTYGPLCFDDIPPTANCASPDGLWHATDVSLPCTAGDTLSGLANPLDANFSLMTSVPVNVETAAASTGSHTVLDKAGNSTTAGPIGGNKVDKRPPSVACGSPDGLWHANNVAIPCTSSDGGSGLASPADASFNLTTSVPAGTETATAASNSHAVPDVVGNTTVAGPISPNKIDRKPPAIGIVQPMATTYTHSSILTLNYTVTDGGSGLASFTPTMNGQPTAGGVSLANGSAISLLTHLPLGPNTFVISAVDNVGNNSSTTVVFTIVVTAQSMIDDVNQLHMSGAITGNTTSLLAKLNAALSKYNSGQCTPAGNQYNAFINEVMAQTGKSITPAAAAILIADAQYLITHCP